MTPVWIGKKQELPDVCCSCGMFTDNRVKLSHSALVSKEVGNGTSLFLIILGLFLGPVGWLLTMFADDSKDVKTVKKKVQYRISQCVLCAAETTPEVLQFDNELRRIEVSVHDRFASQLVELAARVSDDDEG